MSDVNIVRATNPTESIEKDMVEKLLSSYMEQLKTPDNVVKVYHEFHESEGENDTEEGDDEGDNDDDDSDEESVDYDEMDSSSSEDISEDEWRVKDTDMSVFMESIRNFSEMMLNVSRRL